jgi:cholesterol transport system auxiliary component
MSANDRHREARASRNLMRLRAAAIVACTSASLAGCGSLFGPAPPAPHFYTLDAAAPPSTPRAAAPAAASASAPVVIVALPRAAAGFDTDRIVYVREAHRLEPYADNQWIDTPPRMLGPLIAGSLSRTGVFGAVLAAPSPAIGQWELDTEIVRLQHELAGSRVRFTLRATLVDKPTRTVVMTREFDASAPTSSANPAGAVAAANVAVADVLGQLTAFCVDAVARAR